MPCSDKFFTLNAVEFVYQSDAPTPNAWLQFLSSIWEDDPESIDLLQEIFGYLLLPDTSQQKMFIIKGPTRSGKGTIGRILSELIGRRNVTFPTLNSLGSDFGLEPLVGKQLAVISDMSFGKKTNTANCTRASELARQFYEKHGFVLADQTDGAGNEEGEPDALYVWKSIARA